MLLIQRDVSEQAKLELLLSKMTEDQLQMLSQVQYVLGCTLGMIASMSAMQACPGVLSLNATALLTTATLLGIGDSHNH